MPLTSAQKKEQMNEYKRSDNDTGSSEVQVALMTQRIVYLTEHFKIHKKDHHSRQGLQALVNKRRKLLRYMKRRNNEGYYALIKRLGLRDSY